MVQTNYEYSRAPERTEQSAKKNKCNYITSQVVAAAVGTLLTMNVSSMNSIITIVNGALKENPARAGNFNNAANLTSAKNFTNANLSKESFTITDAEATVYGTVSVITTLFASIVSGIYQDEFGRRNCMLVSTLPQILSWFILYFATNAYWLYLHAFAVGIGSAFCEHVVVTYVSESSSIEMRGRMFSVFKFGYGSGAFLTFLLSNFFHWRRITLFLSCLPMILPVYIFLLPESPLWLLSKKRDQECRRSLRWLRGWTSNQSIEDEYQNILAELKRRNAETKEDEKFSTATYIKLFTKSEILEPFAISLALLLSSLLLSLRGMRFYFINFLQNLGAQADRLKIMTITGASGIIGCGLLVLTIHRCGKRALTLWTFSASAVCVFLFALYSKLHTTYGFNAVWMIYVLSAILHCLGGYTLGGMPWFFISEIFPQKYRGFCSGIAGFFGHLMISGLTGTFLSLEKRMGTTNVLHLYCVMGIICLLYLYYHLPETENKSLHDIEEYFKNKNKMPLEADRCPSVGVQLCPKN